MTITVELPEAAQARLEAEAARRGITLGQLVAEAAEQVAQRLPAADGDAPRHRLGFVGIGASGRTEPVDMHRERAELAAKKFADGI